MKKIQRGEKEKKDEGDKPMTPLATLRTAQLFQISWPLTSSIVGIRIGSIVLFSASFVFAAGGGGGGGGLVDESSLILSSAECLAGCYALLPTKKRSNYSEEAEMGGRIQGGLGFGGWVSFSFTKRKRKS